MEEKMRKTSITYYTLIAGFTILAAVTIGSLFGALYFYAIAPGT